MNEKLCDLRAVWLVRRQRDDHLHRPDEDAVGESGEEQPPALLDLGGEPFERAPRILVRERRQVADRCPAGNAVLEDARERIEVLMGLGRGETTDLQFVGVHGHILPNRRMRAMTFEVAAEAYDRFMGRYSIQLAPQLAEFGEVGAGQRVLDVGCGPGALTSELVRRLGGDAVTAVDPSETFVAAAKARHPTAEVHRASAEHLPFDNGVFDAALAQLVVHFMADPVAGLREMARVTRPGGVVAASVWDHAGDRTPLAAFWQAARELDPGTEGEADLAGAREGHLGELFAEAGLSSVQETTVEASLEFSRFEEWWDPFTLGVGPAGAYVTKLSDLARSRLRERCLQLLGPAPFTVDATAWTARGSV